MMMPPQPGGDQGEGGAQGMLMPPGMMGGPMGMMGGQMTGGKEIKIDPLAKPRKGETGFALPVKLTIRSSNVTVNQYIYEVPRRKPMVELIRLELQSMSQYSPDSADVEATITFMVIPRLFGTLESVKKLIDEVQISESADNPQP
jgi:hypothetical protein